MLGFGEGVGGVGTFLSRCSFVGLQVSQSHRSVGQWFGVTRAWS